MRLTDAMAPLPAPPTADTPTPAALAAPVRVPPAGPAADADPPLTVIEARHTWTAADAREVWRFRELFFFLTLRDIKLRYKQTIFGVGWSVFQPLATVLVFAVFLGQLGRVADGFEGASYTLFVLCGVLPWKYFESATTNAANSLVGNERLVTKTYFPRVFLPASNVGAATFDFLIALAVLAVWMAAVGPPATWRLAVAPVLVALIGLTAFGFGTLLSALIATQRDFRYLLTFGMQLWMFATPCIYLPMTTYGPRAHSLLMWNPLYGLVLNFRNCVLGTPLEWASLAVSVGFGALIVVAGLVYFRRVENTMADTL